MPTTTATASTFYELGLAPTMLKVLDRLKFVTPTPIQSQAIPQVMEGGDLMGVAQTGTGKTLAFGIPMIQRIANSDGKGLVLAPTRELAIQIEEALKPVASAFNLTSVVLVGGMPIHRQISKLKKKPRIIIATPGRLIDHLEQRTMHLKDAEVFVLDEADRMFDMGFAPQIERVMKSLPKDRQTLLFSATMPRNVVNLATRHMKSPGHIEIAPAGTASDNVTQEIYIIKDDKKDVLLKHLLQQYRGPVLVFVRTKVKAGRLARTLKAGKFYAAEIHSDRTMGQRKQAIEGFKSGKHQVLVATDVAARGIDVKEIELVVNYDLPDDLENYVHRIGRTGRAGSEGHAISFVNSSQKSDVDRIENSVGRTIPIGDHPEVESEQFFKKSKAASRGGFGGGRGRRGKVAPRGFKKKPVRRGR